MRSARSGRAGARARVRAASAISGSISARPAVRSCSKVSCAIAIWFAPCRGTRCIVVAAARHDPSLERRAHQRRGRAPRPTGAALAQHDRLGAGEVEHRGRRRPAGGLRRARRAHACTIRSGTSSRLVAAALARVVRARRDHRADRVENPLRRLGQHGDTHADRVAALAVEPWVAPCRIRQHERVRPRQEHPHDPDRAFAAQLGYELEQGLDARRDAAPSVASPPGPSSS